VTTHCILQWARLGDLFQTRPLLARIRAQEPDADILLCVDEIFLSLAATFPEPSRSLGIPLRHYWALANSERDLKTLYAKFQRILDSMGGQRPDIVYVLNKSDAAARFAEMLRSKDVRGFLSNAGTPDPPMAYLDTMVADRNSPPVHLADLWAALAKSQATTTDFPAALPQGFCPSLSLSCERLGLLVGAGAPDRVWPVEYWIEFLGLLGDRLCEAEIVLLGTDRDIQGAEYIEEFCRSRGFCVRNTVGQTDLSSLGSILASCDLVVGSDTGGIHFAAALGIQILGIFFAGARAAFTGPYAASSCAIESENFESGNRIPIPKDVACVAAALLDGRTETDFQVSRGFIVRSPYLCRDGLHYLSSREMARSRPKESDAPSLTEWINV